MWRTTALYYTIVIIIFVYYYFFFFFYKTYGSNNNNNNNSTAIGRASCCFKLLFYYDICRPVVAISKAIFFLSLAMSKREEKIIKKNCANYQKKKKTQTNKQTCRQRVFPMSVEFPIIIAIRTVLRRGVPHSDDEFHAESYR